ncbi:Copper resistance protein CopD / Cytochrome c oxidase caa3-type assembly factor CtaG_BS (unrelated to Cox11-CtaG family) [Arthrobacter sp. DR-2P]|uniref:cytochrome c oxidase assembly protein n=1 Tax=unclassified Arthrobacter TaxID=235627 RepID=UPI0010E566EC|nr:MULTISPECIES: cytochrome c oxidase assembly protein [unclassified Arthrobacter]VII98849.1 Copper resistance protein CopD / Cytochrome c oxidase caa3-type assembly factor CtaG_BS (unrelated to Cox11-CtaG family) [Arthrobacter sp. DR-2P]
MEGMKVALRKRPPGPVTAAWTAGGLAAAVLTALAGVSYSGAGQERLLSDPGAIVRWGLPPVLALHHLALAAVAGALIFAATILPRNQGAQENPAIRATLRVAAGAAGVWVLAATAVLLLTYADIAGQPLSGDADFTNQLGLFVTDVAAGRARLAILIIAVLVSILVVAVTSAGMLLATAVLALSSIIPATAAIGHAAGSADHIGASNALGLHVAAGTLWVGGIIALAAAIPALIRPGPGHAAAQTVLRRFSVLAGLSFALVVTAGTASALYRLGSIDGLLSAYGALLLSKTAATLFLGLLGLIHRYRVIPALAVPGLLPRLLWRVLAVELLIMGAVMGLAVALARSPSPVPLEPDPEATPAQILTGYLLPPEPDASAWFIQWRPDWLWITAALLAALFYGRAYARTRAVWPKRHLLSWFSALILLTFITSGPPAVYGPVLLSAHVAGTMTMALPIPWLLINARPLKLALTVLPERNDSSIGPREGALWLARMAARPGPLLSGLTLGSLTVLFYLTSAFDLSLREHLAHEASLVLFLAAGILFARALQPGTESPGSAKHRFAALATTSAGIGVTGLRFLNPAGIEQEWFAGLGRTWEPSAAADQHLAGLILLLACTLSAILITVSHKHRQDQSRPELMTGQATVQDTQQQRNDSNAKPQHS